MKKYKATGIKNGEKEYSELELQVSDTVSAFKSELVVSNLSDLLGKVLTVIDASLPDSTQNKSIKDLIKNEFGRKQDWFYESSQIQMEEDKEDRAGTLGMNVPCGVENYYPVESGLVPYKWSAKFRRVYKNN